MMMKFILLAILSFLLQTDVIYAQFVDQPSEGLLLAPISDQVTFSCSVDGSFSVNWEVLIDGVSLVAARSTFRATFEQRGFTFTGVATTSSTLSFGNFVMTGNLTNNGTVITCIAQQGISSQVYGNEVHVIFYGAPPPPTDLSVTEDELGSLNISWSLGFIEGVPVNYTLTVLNLNTTRAQPIIIAGLLDQHYMFETSRLCDVYSFTVLAETAAGNSIPSQEIIFTRDGSSEICSVTILETGATTITTDTITTATTASNNPGLHGGEIAGIVIGVLVFFIFVVIFLVIAILVWNIRRGASHHSQQLEIAMPQRQLRQTTYDQNCAATKPHMTFDREGPEGLTIYQNKVLLVEKKKKGVTVFENLKPMNFINLDRDDLSEITVHTVTGNMFVTTGATGKVLKLSSTGKLIASIGDFEFSNGLRINSDKLYVCDSGNHQVQVFDLNLTLLKTISGEKMKCQPFQTPRDVDFDEHNNIYIAESRRIQVLSPEGNFLRTIGEGKIIDAISLKITENYIFVTNFGEACVSIFTIDGQHIEDFSKDYTLYSRPMSITIDKDGYIYVSTFRGSLCIFKKII